MTDQIVVTDAGIAIHQANTEGGHTWVLDIAWDELSRIIVYAMRLPKDEKPWVAMDFDYTIGEYATVNHDAAGFAEAVTAIAERGGVTAPDLAQLQADEDLELWRAPFEDQA
jgi:hypothetical protein